MSPVGTRLIAVRSVLRSGLPAHWAAQYPALREGRRMHSAVRHVAETLQSLQLPYRLGFAVVLRVLPLLLWTVGGAAGDARKPAGHGTTLSRIPIVSQVLRITTTLALYGGLDNDEPRRPV